MGRASGLDDPEFLSVQYRDAGNLNARISLHRRFSTNPCGLQRWIFDHLRILAAARVLELGCGPGGLWADNGGRIPDGWKVTLTDLSAGMAGEARTALESIPRAFRYAAADAQSLPFGGDVFDAAIADHMLYHVPDRPRALAEIRRVLRPGGRFYASTGGSGHMRELTELTRGFDPAFELWGPDRIASVAFTLENGAAQIAEFFTEVGLHRFEDALVVTDPAPLVAYALSGRTRLEGGRRKEFADYVEREMKRRGGAIRITKETGLFEAVRV
jgi:SAM-dependent methyltransferase